MGPLEIVDNVGVTLSLEKRGFHPGVAVRMRNVGGRRVSLLSDEQAEEMYRWLDVYLEVRSREKESKC